jgi:Flp pilus assembly protein TadG
MRNKVEKVRRSCRINRRGAAVVEFAVVAPLFILLVFGMIEYGRMVMVQQVLTNASREAARKSVLDGANASTIKTETVNYLTSGGVKSVTASQITINPTNPTTAAAGAPVTVTISIPFSGQSWLPSGMFPTAKAKTLTATAVMRREAAQ